MGKRIALGKAMNAGTALVAEPQELTIEEKITALQRQVEELTKAFNIVNTLRLKDKRSFGHIEYQEEVNKDGIPLGLILLGNSMRGGTSVLNVYPEGYYIGNNQFDSLSAAAEYVSGVRRSGWTFWRMPNGQTLKEAFGKE